MEKLETHYCRACSLKVFEKWKGRPHKDTLPLLPKLAGGTCKRCGGAEGISSGDIAWLNPDGEQGADLSNYWSLGEIAHEGEVNEWGLPYFSEMRCPKCQQRSIVSEINFPDGTTEYKCNCQLCGIVEIA